MTSYGNETGHPSLAPAVARLIEQLNKLPGVGPKSAQRLAYYLIRMPAVEASALAEAIGTVKELTTFCSVCQNITESDPCGICANPSRDRTRICVVQEPLDVLANAAGPLGWAGDLARFLVIINLILGGFNMIPFPPLDGSKIMAWSNAAWGGIVGAILALAMVYWTIPPF